jgi:hypothetical protein
MVLYITAVSRITAVVREHRITGVKLFLLASVPAIDIVAMLVVIGLYLKEEADEFKRHQMVVSILWAIGVTLALNAFVDFLRSYGAIQAPPPFTEFIVFWIVMGVAQAVQSIRNRVKDDDEPAA